MGYLFDEKAYIESNISLHESRASSQFSRFLDSSPTFVTYYRINNIESTTDRGFLNVERILGGSSPIRFNEVTRLPLHGIDQIVLDLELGDEGMNSDFQGSGILLPNTVTPRPGDFFIIDHIGSSLVLSVTDIAYDTIRSNNYYRINFKVKSVDDGSTHKMLKKQTVDSFVCYYENIGTEDKVLMRSGDVDIINALNDITTKIADYYRILYYDNRYNSFLFNREDGYRIYDRVLTRFITKYRIFSKKNDYKTTHLADEDRAVTIDLEYHNSIFRALEERNASLIKDVKYFESFVFDLESVFTRWRDKRVISNIQGRGIKDYMRPELLQFFRDSVDLFAPTEHSKSDAYIDIDAARANYIEIKDTELKPVYVKDQNIMEKEPVAVTEEQAITIKRSEHPYDHLKTSKDDGRLNFDSIFGFGEDVEYTPPTEAVPLIKGDLAVFENEVNLPTSDEMVPDYEEKIGVVPTEEGNIKKGFTIELINQTPQYLETPEEYAQENPMTVLLAKYFSGHDISIYEINMAELKNYMSYMDLNSIETFLLTPMFLYVIEQYFISHLGN